MLAGQFAKIETAFLENPSDKMLCQIHTQHHRHTTMLFYIPLLNQRPFITVVDYGTFNQH